MTLRLLAIALALVSIGMGACSSRSPEPVPVQAAQPETLRQIDSGELVGIRGRYESHAWLGVPFARPPEGDLRWRAPQPPTPWNGIREATEFGPTCPQLTPPGFGEEPEKGRVYGDEDCLTLNLWSPPFGPGEVPTAGARLPVMLWIHGGGNTIGNAQLYNGGNLATSQRVIVISVQYRLGTLGWFRHPALAKTAADDLDRSGNFGTLDLIAALEWVRRNAAAFGGDPNRVTIFGESAGGTNVYSLLMSPPAKGLFHRAIVQSGGIESYDQQTAAASPEAPWGANEVALRTLIRTGRAADRNDAALQHERMSDVELSTFLRSLSVQDLLLIHSEATLGGMYFATDLIRDGKVLPQEEFEDGLRAGKYNRVPVILGSNRDEARLFQFLDPKNVRVWFWLFPRLRDRDHYLTITGYHSQMWKAAGVDQPATSMHANQGDTIFAYRFDWDEEPSILGANFADMLGAAHFLEVPFVFGHFEIGRLGRITFSDENLPGRQEVSEAMMSYWAEFAYTGNPSRGRAGALPQWRAWNASTPDADKFIVLDTQTDGGIRMENTSIREAGILAAIKTDSRLPDLRDKCHLYYKLGEFREVMPPTEYDAFCSPEFPREVWKSD